MKRLPRGGQKVNFNLHIPVELRDLIKERAEAQDCTPGYYLSQLVEMDGDLQALGVSIAPTTEITPEEEEQFGENVSENTTQGGIALPEAPAAPVTPAVPTMQRPRMRSIADLQRENQGPVSIGGSGNARNPGMPEGAGRAAALDPNWQQRMHNQLTQGEGSEAAMRRQVLENLPPESEKKE